MKNWSALKFAVVGFIAGFVLNIFAFKIGPFRPSHLIPLGRTIFFMGLITGTLGLLAGLITTYLLKSRRDSIAWGLLGGIFIYWGLTIIPVLLGFLLMSEYIAYLSYLPSLPWIIFWPPNGSGIVISEHPWIMFVQMTGSWLSYAVIGAVIGYLIEKRKARILQ